jgi:gas vesicle protein
MDSQKTAKQWARTAMKLGLLLTDAKLWADVNDQLTDQASDVRNKVRDTYDEATSRLQDASDALQGRNHWIAPTAAFVGGIALGAGLGMLFAPTSGEEARAALYDRASDLRGKVRDIAGRAEAKATGTHGD